MVAEKIAKVAGAAARKRGRKLSFGIRLHVIVRETSEEAWAAADRLIRHLDDATIAKAQAIFARMDSVGQSRMSALHGGRRDKLVIGPNLWAGVGLVRGGAGTALVGSAEEVAARMEEYRAVGIDTFILSGYPHLEEAYRFAELVFPRCRWRTPPTGRRSGSTPGRSARPSPTTIRPAASSCRLRSADRRRPTLGTLPPGLPSCGRGWEWLRERLLPAPSAVLVAFWDSLRNGTLLNHAAISTERAFKGLVIGGGIGFVLGVSRPARRSSTPRCRCSGTCRIWRSSRSSSCGSASARGRSAPPSRYT